MSQPQRNRPPAHGIRMPADALRAFAGELLLQCGMDSVGASLVAQTLVASDSRCVFSHGTRLLKEYVPLLRDEKLNARPTVRTERGDSATAVINGDGGLGYHACDAGMRLAVARAQQFGVGAVTTYHHHHIGAAGSWARIALDADCIGLAVSSHRFEPDPGEIVITAAGRSPMSIAVPAGEEPPVVLDMGARFLPLDETLMTAFPDVFLKSLGIGAVNAALGGLLAGIWRSEARPPESRWVANQGGFLTAWHIPHFRDVDTFRAEMDRYVGRARAMRPMPTQKKAELAGGMEFAWEEESRRAGIPLSLEHEKDLTELADELGVVAPWPSFEDQRF